ncbi:MAG: MMPL family transporter [Opitutaceae bacterium]
MTPRRQKLAARWILAAGVLGAAAILWLRDAPHRISTDVLDLVPQSESAPELALIRNLAGDRQSRVVLVALDPKAGSGSAAGRLSAAGDSAVESLRKSGAFEDVELMNGGSYRDALGLQVFGQRFDLLGPAWLAERWREHQTEAPESPWSPWLAERTAARLEAFLSQPEAVGFQDLLGADPILLVPGMAGRLQGFADPGPGPSRGGILIWALSRSSSLGEEGQASVSNAIEGASRDVSAAAPGIGLRWTGLVRLAADSRRRIEGEVSRLNLLSLAAVLSVALAGVRRPARALLLAPVVLFSMLGAWTAAMLAFDRVHVLVFVVGSLLCGVAIDYGFYIFLQPPAQADESYGKKVGRLLRPLLASCLTVVLGFSLLLASDLPLIRQVGVFVSAGLLAALAAAILWFAQVDDPFLETRPFARARAQPGSRAFRGAARLVLALAGLVALAGPWRLTWRDDIHDLQLPAPGLEANDGDLRARFGDDSSRTLYFTQAATPAQARESLDRFLDWHARAFPDSDAASIGAILPNPDDWARLPARLAGLDSFAADLRGALGRHGFDPAAFNSFFDAWTRWRGPGQRQDYDAFARDFAASLKGPASLTIACRPDACLFVTLASHPPGAEPPPSTDTFSAHKLETLNELFRRYRMSALRLSALGLGLVGLSVFAIYGFRRGLGIFAVPCGSCLFAFGLFGLCGHPLNLFHLLGAFLGVCLAHNYAIFTWENAARGEIPPPSIRLSALCTAASFGVLSLSGIPVVAALGSMVAVIVLSALAAVEFAPFAFRRGGLAVGEASD